MSPGVVHGFFETLAWLVAVAAGWWARRRCFASVGSPLSRSDYPVYMPLLWIGAVAGAYGLGTLNLELAAMTGEGRSILGAILGGIVAAEAYKRWRGIRGSTGAVFVLPLALAIAVGRLGCFFAGLEDYTYGTPTALPWGVDFGDGISRHPVQLYESFTMAAFALFFFLWLKRRPDEAARNGFYLFVAVYGAQRFLWEFLKPYPTVVGPFNVFHIAGAAVVAYAAAMARHSRSIHALA